MALDENKVDIVVSISLSEDLYRRAKQTSEADGESLGNYMRNALDEYLKHKEKFFADRYDIQPVIVSCA